MAQAQSCLPQQHSNPNTIVHTGVGLTYEEAKYNLYTQLPSVGILQNLKFSTTKMSNVSSYAESNILHKDVNVNFDHLVTYNCKIDGKFAITTLIPRDGISYLPKQHHDKTFDPDVFDGKYSTFAYANKVCGSEIYTVIMSLNDSYEIVNAKKIVEQSVVQGVHRLIICGSFDLKSDWFSGKHVTETLSVFKNRYNMIYLGSYRSNGDIRDYSQELNLEMIKNIMF